MSWAALAGAFWLVVRVEEAVRRMRRVERAHEEARAFMVGGLRVLQGELLTAARAGVTNEPPPTGGIGTSPSVP